MSRNNLTIIECIKWAFAILLVVFIVCSNLTLRPSKTPFAEVSSSVTKAAGLTGTAEGSAQMVKRLYGLNPADYENVLLQYPSSNMGAEELLLIRLKDMSQEEAVVEAAMERLSNQLNNFEGYGVEQTALLNDAVVEARGGYVLLVVSANSNAARAAFRDAL